MSKGKNTERDDKLALIERTINDWESLDKESFLMEIIEEHLTDSELQNLIDKHIL